MTKMTDIELLEEVHMPVGDSMAKEFMRCMLNMYEAGTMLYYVGNRLSSQQYLSVFTERTLSGIKSWDQTAANWLSSFKFLTSRSGRIGAALATPNPIGSSTAADKWELSPFEGQDDFPFDKMLGPWAFEQFKGAWANFMSQVVSPSYQSGPWKIYSCPWIISSALLAGDDGGFTMLWDGLPTDMAASEYTEFQTYARGSLGLEWGSGFGRTPCGNVQTLATMSADCLFAGGDHRMLSAASARGSDEFLSDITGAFYFFDPDDPSLEGGSWAREFETWELATGRAPYLRLSQRMNFPVSALMQNRNLSAKDCWIKAPGVYDRQDLKINSRTAEDIAELFPSVRPVYRQFQALADFYYTHMQSEGDICRFASAPFNFSVPHNEFTDEYYIDCAVTVSVDLTAKKVYRKVQADLLPFTEEKSGGSVHNGLSVGRSQYDIRQWQGDSAFVMGAHTELANDFYVLTYEGGIEKIPGLPAAEAARADSLFPPSIQQQKDDDIDKVRQLSAQQKISAEQQLSVLSGQLSGLNDAYIDKATQGWQYADAPYNYLDGFPWADYTDWSTIDDGCWDYIWANIEDDQTLPTEQEKYDRMYAIEDDFNVWMEDNGGWDAWNAVYDCQRSITNLKYFLQRLQQQAQISVNNILSSTDYEVTIPDVSWLTEYLANVWDTPQKPAATGHGRYGAGVKCFYPAINSNRWTDVSSIITMANGDTEWPLPQYAYAKLNRNAPLSVEDCIPTKFMYTRPAESANLSSGGVFTAHNQRYVNMRYISADRDYTEKYATMLDAIADTFVGYSTKSMLSGSRPDLRQYVSNYETEEDLSSVMPPPVKVSAWATDTGGVCTYEGREAAVLELVLAPIGFVTTVQLASNPSVNVYNWSSEIGCTYPDQPPVSALNYYESGEDNTIEFSTYPVRFRGVRAHLESF